jgi:hypothetical protein
LNYWILSSLAEIIRLNLNIIKNYLIVTAMIILASCSAAKFVPPSLTHADADRLSASYPGLTVGELNEGKLRYETYCALRHLSRT